MAVYSLFVTKPASFSVETINFVFPSFSNTIGKLVPALNSFAPCASIVTLFPILSLSLTYIFCLAVSPNMYSVPSSLPSVATISAFIGEVLLIFTVNFAISDFVPITETL